MINSPLESWKMPHNYGRYDPHCLIYMKFLSWNRWDSELHIIWTKKSKVSIHSFGIRNCWGTPDRARAFLTYTLGGEGKAPQPLCCSPSKGRCPPPPVKVPLVGKCSKTVLKLQEIYSGELKNSKFFWGRPPEPPNFYSRTVPHPRAHVCIKSLFVIGPMAPPLTNP